MMRMRVDHVVYASEHDGVEATAARLGKLLGVDPVDGGYHPRFGTRNMIIPLMHERYVEVVEVLDHPVSYKQPFGQVVRARSEAGGGWLGWALAVTDMTDHEQRLEREAVVGNRHRPDGVELTWRQLGIKGLQADAQLPFFIQWGEGVEHPSGTSETSARLRKISFAGDLARVKEWLGRPEGKISPSIEFDFVAPHGTPGILSCDFETAEGMVTI